MKKALTVTGIAFLVSILLSSPALAQVQPPSADPAPAPADASQPDEELSLDDAIMMASTQEDRARLLMRCAGPPPRLPAPVAKLEEPRAEPSETAR